MKVPQNQVSKSSTVSKEAQRNSSYETSEIYPNLKNSEGLPRISSSNESHIEMLDSNDGQIDIQSRQNINP